MVDEVEHIGAVEYGRMFATFLAVVAARAYVFVLRQGFVQRVKLIFKSFLSTEYIEVVETDHIGNHRPSAVPAVTGIFVAFVLLAYVVCGNIENCTLGDGRYCCCGQSKYCK